jgi:hypothetical protein
MYVSVHTFNGKTKHVPFYPNMTCGQFLTQYLAPVLEPSDVSPVTGDVNGTFLLRGKLIFTTEHRDRLLSEILSDGDKIHYLFLGKRGDRNGSFQPPSAHQLEWSPHEVVGPEVKRNRV